MSAGVFDELFWNLLSENVIVDSSVRSPIVVIGAGIIGLSHALACRASFPNCPRVTVVAKDFVLPTSAVSAGVWFPCMVEDELGRNFARSTYELLSKFVETVEQTVPGAGCQNISQCWEMGK